MRNKILIKIISLFLIIATVILYQIYKLPYGLSLTKIDLEYYIHDEGGMTILAEGYNISNDDKLPMVVNMIAYSKNKLGLVVHCKSVDDSEFFVAIKPKVKQDYLPELIVDYFVYTTEDYKSKKIKDFWINIR